MSMRVGLVGAHRSQVTKRSLVCDVLFYYGEHVKTPGLVNLIPVPPHHVRRRAPLFVAFGFVVGRG